MTALPAGDVSPARRESFWKEAKEEKLVMGTRWKERERKGPLHKGEVTLEARRGKEERKQEG